MHSMLTTPSGQVLMAADTPNSMEYTAPAGHSLSVSGDDEAELRGYWNALSGSGSVIAPLAQAPWGDSFGMCIDRFGVTWMVNIAGVPRAGQDASAAAPVDVPGEAVGT